MTFNILKETESKKIFTMKMMKRSNINYRMKSLNKLLLKVNFPCVKIQLFTQSQHSSIFNILIYCYIK